MEPAFRLRFLGAVQITQSDEPVRGFESRKTLALLGYLAAHREIIAAFKAQGGEPAQA